MTDEKKYRPAVHELGYTVASPIPSLDELRRFYEEKYFQEGHGQYREEYDPEELQYIELGPRVAAHFMRTAAGIESGRVLDAGCGQGFFAAHFEKEGWEVTAADFSRRGVEVHNPSLLKRFRQGNLLEVLNQLIDEEARFELVNLNGVLEHLADPGAVLRSARDLLSEGGVLRLAVPNDYSDFQKMLLDRGVTDETWFVPPEHLCYFSFDSLAALVRAAGFMVERVMGDFPIELFLLNEHSNYAADRSKGKAAHRARIAVELFLASRGLENYVAYCEAAARVAMGRQVILFAGLGAVTG